MQCNWMKKKEYDACNACTFVHSFQHQILPQGNRLTRFPLRNKRNENRNLFSPNAFDAIVKTFPFWPHIIDLNIQTFKLFSFYMHTQWRPIIMHRRNGLSYHAACSPSVVYFVFSCSWLIYIIYLLICLSLQTFSTHFLISNILRQSLRLEHCF